MNEFIILGALCAIWSMFILLYVAVGVVYYKVIRRSKKSIWEIMNNL